MGAATAAKLAHHTDDERAYTLTGVALRRVIAMSRVKQAAV